MTLPTSFMLHHQYQYPSPIPYYHTNSSTSTSTSSNHQLLSQSFPSDTSSTPLPGSSRTQHHHQYKPHTLHFLRLLQEKRGREQVRLPSLPQRRQKPPRRRQALRELCVRRLPGPPLSAPAISSSGAPSRLVRNHYKTRRPSSPPPLPRYFCCHSPTGTPEPWLESYTSGREPWLVSYTSGSEPWLESCTNDSEPYQGSSTIISEPYQESCIIFIET